MKKTTLKKRINRGLSSMQKMFADAINYDALEKALNDPKSNKELQRIFNKVRL